METFAGLIYLKAPNASDGQTRRVGYFVEMRKVSVNCFVEAGAPAMRWPDLRIRMKTKGDSYESQAG